MTLRILTSTLLFALLSAVPALRAQNAPQASPAKSEPKKEEEKTDLEKTMDKMNKAFRALRKQVADATKNDSSLTLVATIRTAAEAASKLIPEKAQDLPEADRPDFVARYRAGIKDLVAGLDKLEADLKAHNNTAAVADVKSIGSTERKNHKEFKRPDKD